MQHGRRAQVGPALVLAVTAISFAAIFFRKADPTHPLVSAGIRLLIAAAVLLPFVLRARAAGRLDGRVLRIAGVAGLFYGLHFGAWVASLQLTSVAASVTLVTANPLLLAIVGLATGRDRPRQRDWAAIGLGLVGLTIVGAHDLSLSRDALLGDALALLGAAAMSGYLLTGRRLGKELDVLAFSGVATLVGGLALLVVSVAAGVPFEPASSDALLFLALAALIPQLIGHNLITWALRHIRPTIIGIAILGEPVGAAFLGWLMLDEGIAPAVAIGCAVTLLGVGLAVTARFQKNI
jgi:drug/metabolite transporter (DMT)-like permease